MRKLVYIFSLIILLTSCEKEILDEVKNKSGGGVTIKFSPSDYFSRLNVSIFDSIGNKVASDAQRSTDKNYGLIELDLPNGKYRIAAILHNTEKSVSISDVNKVVFSGSLGDIHSYYDSLEINDGSSTYNIETQRSVGMFRIILENDNIPSDVNTYTITYTGSKSLNLITGCGVTKAKQTDTKNVVSGTDTLNYYLLPGANDLKYKITLTAYANNTEIATYIFEDVIIRTNEITAYRGKLFNNEKNFIQVTYGFKADATWKDITYHDF